MMRMLWSSIIRSQLSHDELLEFTSLRSAETLFVLIIHSAAAHNVVKLSLSRAERTHKVSRAQIPVRMGKNQQHTTKSALFICRPKINSRFLLFYTRAAFISLLYIKYKNAS